MPSAILRRFEHTMLFGVLDLSRRYERRSRSNNGAPHRTRYVCRRRSPPPVETHANWIDVNVESLVPLTQSAGVDTGGKMLPRLLGSRTLRREAKR